MLMKLLWAVTLVMALPAAFALPSPDVSSSEQKEKFDSSIDDDLKSINDPQIFHPKNKCVIQ